MYVFFQIQEIMKDSATPQQRKRFPPTMMSLMTPSDLKNMDSSPGKQSELRQTDIHPRFNARKLSFNQDEDNSHHSEYGSSAERSSSCSHSEISVGDASEEEDDEDGILANLYQCEEDQDVSAVVSEHDKSQNEAM